jgi:MFS family permease
MIVCSPSFRHNPFRLIGVGLLVWTIATAGCGCSFDFWSITICRMLVGVGEASFISLAAPFIDDNAPAAQVLSFLECLYNLSLH